jgi:membrane protein implicated in regulation of membrane protease activity
MDLEKGFLGAFLVLGFALFIAGFLTGMLAFAVLKVSSDLTTLGIMVFLLGFVVGIMTTTLGYVFLRRRTKRHEHISEPEVED